MDKPKSKKRDIKKDSVQNEKLTSLLRQIREELLKIREKLQKQMVE